MKLQLPAVKKPFAAIQFIMITVWAANLVQTQAYFVTYALCALVAGICLSDNYRHGWKLPTLPRVFAVLTAAVFSLMVTLSNYDLFEIIRNPEEVSYGTNLILNLFNALCTLVGGFFAGENVLRCAFNRFPIRTENWSPRREPWLIFLDALRPLPPSTLRTISS